MDFKKFTADAKLAIIKLETFGLSCLTPCVDLTKKFIITNNDVRIWPEPENLNVGCALAEICLGSPYDIRWTFQLNQVHTPNLNHVEDIIIGFIMFPKYHQNISITDSKINAGMYIDSTCISTFQFEPFKFMPIIHNTYFIWASSPCAGPIIRYNQPVNHDIYYLSVFLQTDERRHCVQHIPLIYDSIMHGADMCEIQPWKNSGLDPHTKIFYDLTTNLPVLPRPNLPFDKDEFLQVTWHPDRMIDWCSDTEQKSRWCVNNHMI